MRTSGVGQLTKVGLCYWAKAEFALQFMPSELDYRVRDWPGEVLLVVLVRNTESHSNFHLPKHNWVGRRVDAQAWLRCADELGTGIRVISINSGPITDAA